VAWGEGAAVDDVSGLSRGVLVGEVDGVVGAGEVGVEGDVAAEGTEAAVAGAATTAGAATAAGEVAAGEVAAGAPGTTGISAGTSSGRS
jgi:hypothetical protein